MPTLPATTTFSEVAACVTAHNPGIFFLPGTPAPGAGSQHGTATIAFGAFDVQLTPPGGWVAMSAADFTTYRTNFVDHYNANGGIHLIKQFVSGNCCIGDKSGNKLIISGTPYSFQFPASSSGDIRCNPAGGYAEAKYQLFKLPTITPAHVFSEKPACVTSHNPGFFMRQVAAPTPVTKPEFGLYDREASPGGGWAAVSLAVLEQHKEAFVDHYNANHGLNVIKPFTSGNCCVALSSGLKLTISNTPYKYQFPASASGDIRCNPTGGYKDARYLFYRVPSLSLSQIFSAKYYYL